MSLGTGVLRSGRRLQGTAHARPLSCRQAPPLAKLRRFSRRGLFPLGVDGTRSITADLHSAGRRLVAARRRVKCSFAFELSRLGSRPSRASLRRVPGQPVPRPQRAYCRYLDQESYVVEHEDRTYDMSQLRGVDFFMVPFDNMPHLAHTMLSFEFAPPQGPSRSRSALKLARNKAKSTPPGREVSRQFELMYVLANSATWCKSAPMFAARMFTAIARRRRPNRRECCWWTC